MSTTLTWADSGDGTQVTPGTAIGYLTDLKTLIDSKSANAAFSWQVVGSNLVSGQTYILLARKDGSAGRIAIMCFATAPSNLQPVLFELASSANYPYIAFFPSGTGTTLSNLNSTSGTVCGNDTNAVVVSVIQQVSTSYASGVKHFYFDSYDGCYFMVSDPTNPTLYCMGGGWLVEDGAGIALPATCGTFGVGFGTFGGTVWTYLSSSSAPQAGGGANSWRVNHPTYGNTNYFIGFNAAGWQALAHGSSDCVLADDATKKAWFIPIYLMPSQVKGAGAPVSIRQLGYGPQGQTAARFTYLEPTTLIPKAIQMQNITGGYTNPPFLTNFKIS